MNVHHRRMIWLLGIVAVLIVLLGALYGYTDQQVGVWGGMYFAVVTVTTVGYGDVIPRGWEDHLVALAIMILIVPLWSAVFSLFTSGLIADHVDAKTEHQTTALKEHVDDVVSRTQP